MKSLKLPRDLFMTPSSHEFVLDAQWNEDDLEYKTVKVAFSLQGTDGEIWLNKQEAERIGKWFTDLSKSVK